MKLSKLGICGIISLLSYTAMVMFSPLAYPGYDWLSMAVSDLSAVGAPSAEIAGQLSALYGPCGLVSIMAVCVASQNLKTKILRLGIYFFAAMEWISDVGYKLFPWVADADSSHPQNIMHLIVTALVVIFSLTALILSIIGAKKEGMKSLFIWACVCLAAMLLGSVGTGIMPKAVFGLFERFSTFSAVTFNAVLGTFLLLGKFGKSFD
ncbi:DUF998 domain-containing protein [Butyrivibrio sp. AE3004]|uniref:DUF998 domain-containing protein n=1 Tax=Butyrivibrio sp. AE3004 TaxID=1506994 RepID=UPI0004947EAA|nr:DUF998 domain-containing protein [Butyrivibrio sp. AE3004]